MVPPPPSPLPHLSCGSPTQPPLQNTAFPAEVFDTYTYSDVGFEGDACPPCIVMQPPVATLQTWMDAQDRTNLVWEEQVSPPYLLYCTLPLPVVTYTGDAVVTAGAGDATATAVTPCNALCW